MEKTTHNSCKSEPKLRPGKTIEEIQKLKLRIKAKEMLAQHFPHQFKYSVKRRV